jgi:hypothetical protein
VITTTLYNPVHSQVEHVLTEFAVNLSSKNTYADFSARSSVLFSPDAAASFKPKLPSHSRLFKKEQPIALGTHSTSMELGLGLWQLGLCLVITTTLSRQLSILTNTAILVTWHPEVHPGSVIESIGLLPQHNSRVPFLSSPCGRS